MHTAKCLLISSTGVTALSTIQRSQQVISIMGQIEPAKYFDDTFEYRHVVLPPKVNTHGEEEDGESNKISYCEKDDWGLLSVR
ncbi:cyclin-dependent kinases regulatory subunit 1 [Tanacetum coccineum]